MSQSSSIVSLLIKLLPIYRKYFNIQDRYISYQHKQHWQDDRFSFPDKYSIQRMIRITEFERWFETAYARLLNVLCELTYVESGDVRNALVLYAKPNFRSHILVGFDVEKTLINQLYIHKKTKLDIQNQNAAHVARFIQLGFPTGHTIMFNALVATPDNWTAF
uniref:Uncharacterized protein n=1 Tax=Romanomermis culicivorax TaxID=13658 RepID=A0A915HIX5_ROMCU